jgi:hypothetical protein
MIREGTAPAADPDAPAPENRINVIVNWLREVADHAPAD